MPARTSPCRRPAARSRPWKDSARASVSTPCSEPSWKPAASSAASARRACSSRRRPCWRRIGTPRTMRSAMPSPATSVAARATSRSSPRSAGRRPSSAARRRVKERTPMADDETTNPYEHNAELDTEKAGELRSDAASLHHDAEHLDDQADDVQALGRADEAARLRAQGNTIEGSADELDRRAGLLEDAAVMWREAGDDERRSDETRSRIDPAFERSFDLRQRVESTPLTDDEITEMRIEVGRADGELAALRDRTDVLANEARFDVKLAETQEAAAGFVRPPEPPRPEPEPNPDLLPLE